MKKKIILFLVSTVIAVSLTGCKSGDYNEAVKLQEAGDYQAALELYESIEDYENYKDTAERVDECKACLLYTSNPRISPSAFIGYKIPYGIA